MPTPQKKAGTAESPSNDGRQPRGQNDNNGDSAMIAEGVNRIIAALRALDSVCKNKPRVRQREDHKSLTEEEELEYLSICLDIVNAISWRCVSELSDFKKEILDEANNFWFPYENGVNDLIENSPRTARELFRSSFIIVPAIRREQGNVRGWVLDVLCPNPERRRCTTKVKDNPGEYAGKVTPPDLFTNGRIYGIVEVLKKWYERVHIVPQREELSAKGSQDADDTIANQRNSLLVKSMGTNIYHEPNGQSNGADTYTPTSDGPSAYKWMDYAE